MIKENLSFEEYCQMAGVNFSKLKTMERCPYFYKWASETERKDTDALRLGRLIHTLVLEPELVNAQFLCLPEIDRRTVKGREQYNELVSQNPDKVCIKQDEFNQAVSMATEVRSNSFVLDLLRGAKTEVTSTWTDADTGMDCKARVDAYNTNGIVVDLKTTIDASPKGFARKLSAYGYDGQAAYYLKGLQENGVKAEHFVFIAVEKSPPYLVGLYRLSDEVIKLSSARNQSLLRRYAECKRTDNWPGYTVGIQEIGVPTYAINEMEENYGINESL
jgi:exodeoxyribonuclease VIII